MNYLGEVDSPLFMVSGPELVMAQCESEVFGSFLLNTRPQSTLDDCWVRIKTELTEHAIETRELPSAPTNGGLAACISNGD